MSFQCLFGSSTDAMGFVVTIQKNKDVFENKGKVFLDRGEGLKQNLQSMIGKKVCQDRNDQIIAGENGVQIQKANAG